MSNTTITPNTGAVSAMGQVPAVSPISFARQVVVLDPAPGNTWHISGTTMPFGFPTATIGGNAVVFIGCIANSSVPASIISAVADTNSNSFTQTDRLDAGSTGLSTGAWYIENLPSLAAGDVGGATGGSATTIVDTTKNWAINQWVGAPLRNETAIFSATVVSNTATTLTYTGGGTSGAGNQYYVGGAVLATINTFNSYDSGILVEINSSGAGTFLGHSAAQNAFSGGTDNISTGTAALGSNAAYLLGFCVNDENGGTTPFVPLPGGSALDGGIAWNFDIGQPIARLDYKALSNPGTTDLKFSAQNADHFQAFLLGFKNTSAGSSNTTITPPTGTVTIAGNAPSALLGTVIVPTTAALTAAGKNPQVAPGFTRIPSTGTVTIAGVAPQVSPGQIVFPLTGAVTVTGQPAAVRPIDPPTATVAITGQPATMIVGTLRTPQTGAVVVAGVAPQVSQSLSLTITPATGAVALVGQTVAIVQNTVIQAAAAILTLVGQQPVQFLQVPAPQVAQVIIQGYAPTVTVQSPSSGNVTITPSTAAVAIAGQTAAAPTGSVITPPSGGTAIVGQVPILSTGFTLQPASGTLVFNGVSPVLSLGTVIAPSAGAIVVAGSAPVLQSNTVLKPLSGALIVQGQPVGGIGSFTVTPPSGTLSLGGNAPTLGFTIPTVGTGSVAVQGYAPVLLQNAVVTPSTAGLSVTGQLVLTPINNLVVPQTAVVALIGYPPVVQSVAFISPQTGSVTVTGQSAQLGSNVFLTPSAGVVTIASAAPSRVVGNLLVPATGILQLSSSLPQIMNPVVIAPGSGTITIRGIQVGTIVISPFSPTPGFVAVMPALKRIAYYNINVFARD